jgi:hypothetical protein
MLLWKRVLLHFRIHSNDSTYNVASLYKSIVMSSVWIVVSKHLLVYIVIRYWGVLACSNTKEILIRKAVVIA